MRWLMCSVLALIAAAQAAAGSADKLGFTVPEGFTVSLYADDSLATDIHCLTIDAKGRVVVAGKGYVKILVDTDGDGRADKALLFADFPKSGAHGMYFDGPDLIVGGDNGVRRLYDTAGKDRCDRMSPVWFPTKNDGEHAANGLVRGPDGWYYQITGNDAAITRDHITRPGSPIKEPNSGVLLRFSPDGKTREILAHGFRNPYDLDFNHLGHIFTVDADGERVTHTPYYAPTRLFDIAQGMHHGWLLPGWSFSWSRPAAWPDNTERACELGRGSPTGLLAYRHHAFPARYHQGIFSLCWTFGRVYFLPLERSGSTYATKMEVFMRTTGDVGFAPTDMAVGPDGDLFIAIGGRGTRGSVFRVRWTGKADAIAVPQDPVRAVLGAAQPLSSWSRGRWVPQARKLGKAAFHKAVADRQLSLEERIRAVEVLTELFGGVPLALAQQLSEGDPAPELSARLLWSLAHGTAPETAQAFLVARTAAAEPRIARAAWEALQGLPPAVAFTDLAGADWLAGFNSGDRRVRAAAIAFARGRGHAAYSVARPSLVRKSSLDALADLWIQGSATQTPLAANVAPDVAALALQKNEPRAQLEAIRLLQLALGDVDTRKGAAHAFLGYEAAQPERLTEEVRRELAAKLTPLVPSGTADVDLEAARLLAMLGEEAPTLLERLAGKWTTGSAAEDDLHYLLVLSRIPGKRAPEVTHGTAGALLGYFSKLATRGSKPSDQVPGILETLFVRLQSLDPALAAAVVAEPAFGQPGHALYARKMPLVAQQAATRKLLATLGKLDADAARLAWSPELIQLVGALPEAEALPILRAQLKEPALTDSAVLVLASLRRPEDHVRFIQALGSMQASVVRAGAEALLALPARKPSALDIGQAVRALSRLEKQNADSASRQALCQLLARWTAQPALQKDAAAPWVAWYSANYPNESAKLPGLVSASWPAWKQRLAKVDWNQGDLRRGELLFQRQNCARCHGSNRRLGPDLTGVAQRFGRDDLFEALVDPSKDILPAYRPTTILTHSGKVYTGVLIYNSPELNLLQTRPDTTVRVPREDLQQILPGTISFMPNGLLDNLHDGELADLYAYLKTLRKQ